MPKKSRKLNKEFEKKINSSKKNVELVLAKIYDIDDEDIQKEYMSAFNIVVHLYDELKEPTFDPVVEGAREENNKWRGRKHDFIKDVKVKAILFDQILVSQNLKDHVVDRGVYTGASAVVGMRSRIRI